ncbi:MAG: carbohydrate porin [Pirellulales bacterium]|nr:carbohydrate porin [Pirellulales bacterium]
MSFRGVQQGFLCCLLLLWGVRGLSASPAATSCTTAPECVDPCQIDCPSPSWCEQPYLTGDWCGYRSSLAESGIVFDLNVGQFYYGVTSGGLERTFEYAGHGDYVANADLGKLLGCQGLFLKLRAEHRFGQSIGDAAGVLIAPTIATDLPRPEDDNLYLTNVLFTQALSENFAVFAGKTDTLDGDLNAFAHGRGMRQFSNFGLVANPVTLRTIPYSTLGAGFVILRELEPIFTFTVLNAKNTIDSDGFSELFAEGVAIATEARLPTTFFGLPGHQLFGGTWNSRDVVSLEQSPGFLLPNVPIARASDSWSLYYNFDQYLVVDPQDPKRGWGVFGRAGIADQNTNPLSAFLSAGVGGSSWLANRARDTFGAGWFYVFTSEEIGPDLLPALGLVGDSQGVELFYNIEVTPWFHLTPDLQVLMPARQNLDTALLVGLRGVVTF